MKRISYMMLLANCTLIAAGDSAQQASPAGVARSTRSGAGAEQRSRVERAREFYEHRTKREATRENVLRSMSQDGTAASEVALAVDAYAALYPNDSDYVQNIEACFQKFGKSEIVADSCASGLKASAPEKAREFWASVAKSQTASVTMRLLSAEGLLDQGDLRGAVTVADGLRSKHKTDRQRATELLERYVDHDGQLSDGKQFNAKALIDVAQPHLEPAAASALRGKLQKIRGKH